MRDKSVRKGVSFTNAGKERQLQTCV